jgi:hypothetical protein
MFIEAEFAFNEGGNDGFWRFQLRSKKTGRWVKMNGLVYFEYRIPGDKNVYRAYGTFQGNIRRGASIIRVGEGESLPPGDYEIASEFVEPVKAMLKAGTPTSKTDVVDAPKKIDEAVGQEAAGKQVVASTVGDLEVGDIVQQKTESGLYGRIASVDHSGATTKLNVEWSDGTAFDMDLPKDQKIRVWNSQNADVPTTNGGLDWANNDEWYQQALDEYDENRAVMNGDSNAPTNFAPGDNLYSEFEGSTVTTVPSSDPNKKFDVEATKKDGLQIVDFKQRKVVMADINGVQVPFYLSTGAGGKKDVQAGKWYPFFGIEEGTQWINKASGDYINDYYGSPELRAQAEWLDANIGDIRDDNTVPIVRADDVTAFLDKVNVDTHQVRLDKDGLGNDKLDTLIKANIADIVNRVRMDPDALQKKADEARARVEAVKKQMEKKEPSKWDGVPFGSDAIEDSGNTNYAIQEPNPPAITYHVAPRSAREDILANGLDPKDETWNTGAGGGSTYRDEHLWEVGDDGEEWAFEYRPVGIYMFETLEEAQQYASATGQDIYQIDTKANNREIIRDPVRAADWDSLMDEEHTYVTRFVEPKALTLLESSDDKSDVVDAPKSDLKPEMDGEDALSIIRDAAAEVAAEDGRFPVARSAEDVEAAAKKQYAGVFETLKAENPDLVEQFKDYDEFWAYAKKSLAAGVSTRYADSVAEIPALMKAANRIYARDVLGLDPDGEITFYRNAINNHADVAKAAAGYASLDKNMAFNYNSDKENNGANGRYSVKAKPNEILGLLGYSDAVDEHGVVIGPDVAAIPGRVERLGDLGWTPVNELMDPELTNTGSGGGSKFRFFSTASTFEFPVLDANPFAAGENDKWSDFYAANGLETGAIPGKYDELYGEGAFERDFPGSSGVPRYDIARDLFTEKDGQFALDPIKFDETFKGSGSDLQGRAGDGRDKALKFFEAVQGLSGQRIMVPRGSNKNEEAKAVLQEIQSEVVDAPNVVEEVSAVEPKRLTPLDGGVNAFWKNEDGSEREAPVLKAGVAKALSAKMRELGITDEQLDEFTRYVALKNTASGPPSYLDWEGIVGVGQIQVWDSKKRTLRAVTDIVKDYFLWKNTWDSPEGYMRSMSSSGDFDFTMDDARKLIEDLNSSGYEDNNYSMYMDLSSDDKSEIAVSTMVSDWAGSSNDAHPRSLAVQNLAEEVFGIENASKWDSKVPPKTLKEIEDYMTEFGDVYRGYIQSQYALTQEYFKDAGITEVVLYRGMSDVGYEDVKGLDQREVRSTEIQSRPLSSWSTNIDTAYEFGISHDGIYTDEKFLQAVENDEDMGYPLLMRQVVPVENIFATPFTGVGCYNEQEMVVLGGEARADAVIAAGDDQMRILMEAFEKEEEAKRAETRENPGPGGIIGRDKLGNPIYENSNKKDKIDNND